jgi:hypothetical protein
VKQTKKKNKDGHIHQQPLAKTQFRKTMISKKKRPQQLEVLDKTTE